MPDTIIYEASFYMDDHHKPEIRFSKEAMQLGVFLGDQPADVTMRAYHLMEKCKITIHIERLPDEPFGD